MTNVISPVAKAAKAAKAVKELTLNSPEVVKALTVAVGSEDAANTKWVTAASNLYMAGVRFGHIVDGGTDYVEATYNRIRDIVVQAQKASIATLLMASSTIGFTDQERADRRYYKNRVDNVHMKRVAEHLKKFEETERGAQVKRTMGESMARKCQDMIDAIRKAKEDKVDFDASEAIVALRACKEIFLA
jgi:hypothetical protein